MQAISHVQLAELFGCCADLLEDNHDGALFAVIGSDGQRDALAVLVYTQDNELAGLSLFGDMRGLDNHLLGICIECLFFKNFVHSDPPP